MSIVNIQALKQNNCVLHWSGNVATANSPKSISSFGDCKQILPFPSAGIGMFDSTGNYLAVTDWYSSGCAAIYDSDFTFETWANFSDVASDKPIFSQYITSNDYVIVYWGTWDASNQLVVYGKAGGSIKFLCISSFTPVANTWYHITVVRSNSTCLIFVDGTSKTVDTRTAFTGTTNINADLKIGAGGSIQASETLSEVRFSNVARYTSNFTPPRRQLESDANTKLLIHFNRNDTTFIDSSPSAHTITRYGDAKQLCSPCGSGVAYFDGTGDYLTVPDHADWYYGSGDFCIEFNIKPISTPAEAGYIYTNESDYHNVLLVTFTPSNTIQMDVTSSDAVLWNISSAALTLGTWYHVACVRYGNYQAIYINGVQSGTTAIYSGAVVDLNGTLYLGSYISGLNYQLNAYLSEFRVSKGTARYTGAFTPPTTPFTPDPYTKLLLHMDGVGNAFYDSSDPPGDNGFPILPAGVTVTPSGTFTTQKMKDGRNIWYFNSATPNMITLSDLESWTLGVNNFTISLWAKMDTVNAIHTLFHLFAATNSGVELYTNASAKLCLKVSDTSTAGNMVNTTGSATLVASTWYHIAVVRNGSAFTIYLNCISDSTGTSAATIINPTAIAIGCRPTGTPDQYQLGCIKDLQLFAGKALSQDQIAAIMAETYIY